MPRIAVGSTRNVEPYGRVTVVRVKFGVPKPYGVRYVGDDGQQCLVWLTGAELGNKPRDRSREKRRHYTNTSDQRQYAEETLLARWIVSYRGAVRCGCGHKVVRGTPDRRLCHECREWELKFRKGRVR